MADDTQNTEKEPQEGGEAVAAEAEPPKPTRPRDVGEDRVRIARLLIWILAVGLLFHYIVLITLSFRADSQDVVEKVEAVFNAWLPVLSGLVGSAVTYYFTSRETRS